MSDFGFNATVSNADAFQLSLYIGQYKAPVFKTIGDASCADPTLALKTVVGIAVAKDIFGCLKTDGTSGVAQTGGLTVPAPASHGSASASQQDNLAGDALAYNLNYSPTAGYVGTDSFNLKIVNPVNSPAGLSMPINVTVFGFTSGLAASGKVGQVAATVYTIDSNDASASFGASLVGSPAGGAATLAALGLSVGTRTVDGTGAHAPISGSIPANAVPGQYTVRVSATINGVSPAVVVTQDVVLKIGGITSSPTPASIAQDGASQTTYNITSFPAATGGYTLAPVSGTLPSWISLNAGTGAITVFPTTSGTFDFTIGATTSAPVFAVTGSLRISVTAATAPVISTTMPASPVAAGTVGTAINWAISASTPPAVDAGSYTLVPTGPNPGLTVNANSGAIGGIPNASGDFVFSLGATNSGGSGIGTKTITVRINPSTAPVVGSGNPPNATVGSAFPAFSIVASNPPVNSYAVAAASALPSGLLLNTGTGAITGIPSASGVFKTSFSATNLVSTSVPQELTFTIIASQKPTITSPTFAGFLAGVAITPIQLVATNPAITAYKEAGLPNGLQLDTVSGIITGTPATPGIYTVRLAADNAAAGPAFGPELDVQFTIGVPGPSACAMSVPLNTPTTLDLATCLFGGFAPTGVSILSTPVHGTAVASGTRVTYAPANNYFGADSFTFVGTGAGGTSPQGTVTVTVTGRPDPVQDAVVREMMITQTETAQRFSRAQVSNFQRRMESLHRSAGATAQAGTSLQGGSSPPSGAGFGAAALASSPSAMSSSLTSGLQANQGAAIGPQTAGAITSLAANHAPTAARKSDVLSALVTGLGVEALPFAEELLSLAKNRSVSLAGVASGMGFNGTGLKTGGTNYWIEGVATFGSRDANGNVSSSEFSSNGITVGVDRRYSDQLALGMGLGYARDRTEIGSAGSVSRAKGYSLAVYGSYQPSPATFVDALLGVGSLDFDTTRFVAPMNDFALGKRRATQLFGSLTGGYEFRDKNLLVSPYGRIDFSTNRLDTSTETGAGAFALTYFGQTSTSAQGSLGVRAESIHATDFGYAVPRLRAEYRHELKRSGLSYVGYADQVGGTRYALAPVGSARGALVLGLGSDFLLRDGLTLAFEYQLSHSFSNASTHALRLRLSKDFDTRGLPRLLSQDPEAAHDEPNDIQLETGIVHDDNVTQAKAGPDRLSDYAYSLNASKTFVQPLTDFSRVLLTATFGGEKFRRYNGLSRVRVGGEAEYQYRASSEFDQPMFGVFARFSAEGFESRLRDGYRFSVGVSVRQALTDRINAFAAVSHNLRNASSQVFSTREDSIRANLDYALSDSAILYAGVDLRHGDIVSTGRPSLENASVADVFAQDDAYPGGGLFSYRFRGNTVLWTMGYNLGLGPRDSIDFSWRHIRSTPGLRPSFVTTPKSYKANQLSAVYLMRF